MQITSSTLDVYQRLGRTPDGQLLRKHLDAELEKVKRTLLTAPTDQVPKLQGRGAVLDELLEALKT